MKRPLTILLCAAAVFFATALSCGAKPSGPTEQLKPTLDQLVEILSDSSLKGQGKKKARREKIMSTIAVRFDFREMSRRILSSTWKKINRYEKDYFTKLMTKLLENNYIGQLESYSGEKVEFVGERIKSNKAQVSTLIKSRGAKFPVHYIMVKNGDNWMVYDINIEGVSLVRNYRAEFKSIIRKNKFEGLVKVLEDKNRSFE